MPAARSRRSVRGASGRSGSASMIAPASSPSTRTQATTAPSREARDTTDAAQPASSPSRPRFPTRTRRPPTTAAAPVPASSWTSVGTLSANPRNRASATIAVASTWGKLVGGSCQPEHVVDRPARCGDHVGSPGPPRCQGSGLIQNECGRSPEGFSGPPPRTRTPIREARDNPDTIATGAASNSGHGVATTRTATARAAEPLTSHASPATDKASGTNQAATRSARRTTGADSAAASFGQPDDPGVGAVRRRRRSADLQSRAGIGAAAAHHVSRAHTAPEEAHRSARNRR